MNYGNGNSKPAVLSSLLPIIPLIFIQLEIEAQLNLNNHGQAATFPTVHIFFRYT